MNRYVKLGFAKSGAALCTEFMVDLLSVNTPLLHSKDKKVMTTVADIQPASKIEWYTYIITTSGHDEPGA